MGMKFTPEQQRVIELHNSNILVSAAAGRRQCWWNVSSA
jgi:hypothetical protein